MIGFFEPKEKIIERYVDEAFDAVNGLFSSKQEFIDYLNSFGNPREAELFIKICRYYLVAKKHQPTSYIKLIMIVSAIERIANREKKYQEFYDWIESRKQDQEIERAVSRIQKIDVKGFKEIIRVLKEEYSKMFGSQRNVFYFFRDHLIPQDKMKMCKSLRTKWTDTLDAAPILVLKYGKDVVIKEDTLEEFSRRNNLKTEKHLMPYCYNWKRCYVQYGKCFPEIGCPLKQDEASLNQALKMVIDDIYQMRSDFVHEARITPLNEKDAIGTLAVIGGSRKPVSVELTTEELESIFEGALKHYFDQFAM